VTIKELSMGVHLELEESRIRKDLESTLRNLKRDWVDLYYIHKPPKEMNATERLLDIYEKLKNEGKVRFIGVSVRGVTGPNVENLNLTECRDYIDSGRVDVLQVIFSMFRQRLRPIMQYSQDKGVGIVARTVLENGFLTGKYRPGYCFAEDDHRTRWDQERLSSVLTEVEKLNHPSFYHPFESLAHAAIRFVLEEKGIASVILGAKKQDQASENMRAALYPDFPKEMRRKIIELFGDKTDDFNTRSY
jgi:aryl-alcohol dehydrogenase-like predicted oxidoreductase